MKTDIEIARGIELKKIKRIAETIGIEDDNVLNYGKYMAKIPVSLIDDAKVSKSNLILVTAITPTKAGIGKTTVSIGLALGMNKIGKNAIVTLREPSLGPCFGMKGGAAGGGYAQVLPMENINLHFTGDFHAITTAHNMITALLDNYLYQNKKVNGPVLREILWKRVIDINDRSLQGERDSELAVMVRDSEPLTVRLDGKNDAIVGKAIHQLRVNLWKKHFGLSQGPGGFVKPASELSAYLSIPAAQEAWEAIQTLAKENTRAYERTFNFIPQNISQTQLQLTPEPPKGFEDGFPASIWPTWAYRKPGELRAGGQLMEPMPYQEIFWRSSNLTSVKTFPPPNGVSGFITALPTSWTRGERNDSGLNLSILAHQDSRSLPTQVAMNGDSSAQGKHRT